MVERKSTGLSTSFKGSSFSVKNVVSTLSLNKDGQLTYNPYYAVSVQASPRFWFTKSLYTSVSVGAVQEITNSDSTTQRGETMLDDITVRLGLSKIASIPGGLTLSGSLDGLIPTSKASQARTMLMGIRPALNLSWVIPGAKGLSFSYSVSGTWYVHNYTTASKEVPLIPGCSITDQGCDAFSHNGLRNTQWRLINSVSTNFNATSWLGFSATFVVLNDFLYALEPSEEHATSFVPQEPTSTRYILAYDLSTTIRPTSSMSITLGASTANPQMAPDTSYYRPFFNRYTNLYLNLSLDVASFFASSPERKDAP
jgi:hypothetical protein